LGALPIKFLRPVHTIVEQQQLIALQGLGGLDQRPHLPLQGLRVRDIRAYLNQARHPQALLDDKIHFLVLLTPPIEQGNPSGNFLFFQLNRHKVFVKRAPVRTEARPRRSRHSIINAVDFFILTQLILHLEREARKRKDQVGLLKIADIFIHSMNAAALRHPGQSVQGILAGHVRHQIQCEVLDPLNRTDLEPFDDVLVQGGLQQSSQIITPVDLLERGLRVAALLRVSIHQCHLLHHRPVGRHIARRRQEFAERERKQRMHCVTARKMRGQFRTEQVGVTTGDEQPESLPLQAIDKQFPVGKILNLIKKQATRIAVNVVNGAHDFVKITGGGQTFIIEIDIAIRAGLLNQVNCKKRLSRSSRTRDDLYQIIPELPGDRQPSLNIPLLQSVFQFPFLNQDNIF